MRPKKKDPLNIFLGVVLVATVMFFAVHGASAYKDAKDSISETGGFSFVGSFGERLASHIQNPLAVGWNEHSQRFVMWGVFGCFLVIASTTNGKKKYIAGKEYGTAQWGGTGDIMDLFAANILKEELRGVWMNRFPVTRLVSKFAIQRQAERDGAAVRNRRMGMLKENIEADRANAKADRVYTKDRIRMEKGGIDRECREIVTAAKVVAWKPTQIKVRYDEIVNETERLRGMRHLTESEYNARMQEEKNRYKAELKAFYMGKDRMAELKAQYRDADSLLTKTERISLYNHKNINNNILIIGGSGSGKTRNFLLPNILQAHSSYVVTDPKGEILEKAGRFLEECEGYVIRVLNLDEKTKSDGYNPFVYLHPEREGFEERVLSLIKTIIINTDGGEKRNSSDPFWEKAEELFLQAIFFFTAVAFPLEERNMNTVLALIAMLQIADEHDDMKSDLDHFAKLFAEEYGYNHIGYEQYNEFRTKASGRTAKSIVISAVARLAPFRTDAIRKLFSYDTMRLDMIGKQKMAIFVVLPPTEKSFNFIAGILFDQLFKEIQYTATVENRHKGQKLDVPVRFLLDEFANTCTIPNFVQILAYARSFGVGIVPILQSLEQIKNMYKDEWQVIVDTCSTRLFLGGISSMDTLEYISKMLGKGTFDKRTTGRTRSRQGSTSQNWDKVGRELMDAAEISKLDRGDCLLLVSGRNPFYSRKYDYTSHPNYRYTSDGNKSYSYVYRPAVNPLDAIGVGCAADEFADMFVGDETDDVAFGHTDSGEDEFERYKRELAEIRMGVDSDGGDPNEPRLSFTGISLVDDPRAILGTITANAEGIALIGNDLMNPDGDEMTDEEANALLELLFDEASATAAGTMLSRTAGDMDEIKIDGSEVAVLTHIAAAVKGGGIEPIGNNLMNPDGDEMTDEEAEYLANMVEDDDYEGGVAVAEVAELANSIINDLIDALPPDALEFVRRSVDTDDWVDGAGDGSRLATA